jgi:methylenetetrahydrofolate reductase (NADPH)
MAEPIAGREAQQERGAARFSFELYPPRSAEAATALQTSLDHLIGAGPDFVSVTYGANGSSHELSLGLLEQLIRRGATPMAHLTCVGSSYSAAAAVIREFLDAGVTRFLALRGDPPAGAEEGDQFLDDLRSAAELVQLIQRVHAERVPFVQTPVRGFPGTCRLTDREKVTIAVAAFPNGHPRSRSITQDLDALLAKQAAGASLAISQLFFEADDFLGFVDRARAAGVTMRILPGMMPVLSAARLRRIVELTGATLPAGLLRDLESADDPAAVGIAHASALARRLLDGGAPGLHLYTFNRHEAPLAVLGSVGLLDPVRTSA